MESYMEKYVMEILGGGGGRIPQKYMQSYADHIIWLHNSF